MKNIRFRLPEDLPYRQISRIAVAIHCSMDQLLNDFLGDAEVLIERLADDLRALRAGHQDGRTRRELVSRIFRHAHTLKGSSSALELTAIAEITHEFESLLDSVRSGRLKLDEAIFEAFDETTSSISEMLAVVAVGQQPLVQGQLVERLRDVGQARGSEQSGDNVDVLSGISAEIAGTLSEPEKHRLREAMNEGAGAFAIEINFELATFDKQFKDLSNELSKCGEIISTQPGIVAASPEQIAFRIIFAGEKTAPQLTELLNEAGPIALIELVARSTKREDASVPLNRTLARAIRAGQVAARATGKEVDFEIEGGETRLDKALSDAIADPLLHLLRNAVDHGIESPSERLSLGKLARPLIRVEILVDDEQIHLRVLDNGRGIDTIRVTKAAIERGMVESSAKVSREESLRIIFAPGFSTAETISSVSGRGVGLDVVSTAVEQIGGKIHVQSEVGVGTTFELVLPIAKPSVSA